MLDIIVLLVAIIIGGVVEPQTFEQEIISCVIVFTALLFEAIRFSVWSKRERNKAKKENERIFREIARREFMKNGWL